MEPVSTVDTNQNTANRRSEPPSLALIDITPAVRRYRDYNGHEKVVRAIDRESGLHAIVAVHDRTLGPALGGCRMWSYDSEADAITDALRLSHGMTLKAAMAGVSAGGGKSVILGDPKTDKTEALLRAFGRTVDSFDGQYVSGEDVGISVQDVEWAALETRHILGCSDRAGDPSPMTAYGVYVGIMAAVRRRLRRETLDGVTVAVQGLGHVGLALCTLLHDNGAQLVVADIEAQAVTRVVSDYGATAVPPENIHRAEVDVFAPCALGAVINDDTIAELRCAVIAGSANNQLSEDRHGEMLWRRHILYAPDYVINAGGLIALSRELAPDGYRVQQARAMTALIGDTLAEIFARAESTDAPTNDVADRIANERVRRRISESAA